MMRLEDAQREMRDVYLGGSVGAHYLPFVTLYGQPAFYGVAAVMVGAGFVLPMLRPDSFALGGWLGGAMLVLTGVMLGILHARERAGRPRPAHSP
jgi:hypothetical protein